MTCSQKASVEGCGRLLHRHMGASLLSGLRPEPMEHQAALLLPRFGGLGQHSGDLVSTNRMLHRPGRDGPRYVSSVRGFLR